MRKDDVMHKRLRMFKAQEGVVFVGVAQEKARVPRTTRKGFCGGREHRPVDQLHHAMVKHYIYCGTRTSEPSSSSSVPTFPTRKARVNASA